MAIAKEHSEDLRWNEFINDIIDNAGIIDDKVEASMRAAFTSISRAPFVEGIPAEFLYQDISLPLGFSQVLSPPSVLVRMLSLISPTRGMRVLEAGCGSGYLVAVLSRMGIAPFAIESAGLLAQRTRKTLDNLGFQDVMIHRGDGKKGWSEHAPYDGIIVSFSCAMVEQELINQLNPEHGKLIIPIIEEGGHRLTLFERGPSGTRVVKLEKINFE